MDKATHKFQIGSCSSRERTHDPRPSLVKGNGTDLVNMKEDAPTHLRMKELMPLGSRP